MAEGHEVARAVVTIVPSLAGAQKTISKELGGAADNAADSAGKSSGGKWARSELSRLPLSPPSALLF